MASSGFVSLLRLVMEDLGTEDGDRLGGLGPRNGT